MPGPRARRSPKQDIHKNATYQFLAWLRASDAEASAPRSSIHFAFRCLPIYAGRRSRLPSPPRGMTLRAVGFSAIFDRRHRVSFSPTGHHRALLHQPTATQRDIRADRASSTLKGGQRQLQLALLATSDGHFDRRGILPAADTATRHNTSASLFQRH